MFLSFLTPLTFHLPYQISPSFYITSVPEDEEFKMALQTEIASELTGTGNTEEDGVAVNQIDIKKVHKNRVEEEKEKEGSLWERYEATQRE